jgi:hypothetical protein
MDVARSQSPPSQLFFEQLGQKKQRSNIRTIDGIPMF